MAVARKISRFNVPGMAQSIPMLAVLMEVLWVYALLVWLSKWPAWGWERPPLTFLSCLILALAVELISRISLNKYWSMRRIRFVVLPISLILLAILVRWNLGGGYGLGDSKWLEYASSHVSSLVAALAFGIYLIWRGIANSRQRLNFHDIYHKFIIGLVGIIFLLVVWGFVADRGDIWPFEGIYIISFFGVGLLTMAIANLDALRTELLKYQEATGAFTRRWVSMLIALVLAILGLSIGLASVFSSNLTGTVIHGFSVLGDWILIALSYVLWPLGFVLEGVIYLGRLLIAWLTKGVEPPKLTMPDLSDLQKMAEGQPPVQIPAWIILFLKWGFLILIVGLVIFFLSRALIRYWEGHIEKDVDEVHETVWSWDAFKMDLRNILAWLFRWARKKKSTHSENAELSNPLVISDAQDPGKLFNIRELYQALLWQGRQYGTPRQKSETPYEYRRKLVSRLDKVADEIDALTEAYISERYGEVTPEAERLNFLNRIWRTLRSKLATPESDN